eukprot:CAMPEP_0181258620 /NCGR_PEP_ID=MMETSP1096-20121128/50873_1 /TAXON_ID=156174 ORGANISM="Chrysochromulina ericina, Strain CCMP281" /NCGR_SAMPLE_ID=MMETSP1096 /ASSEMBLY_ACC=CAM_ASM_000453 /LENGTH=161 /DNA_ID=CAMNT_0023357013 /DNA_START=150 /DNA_END=635 /DNA_ORIENTATION=-
MQTLGFPGLDSNFIRRTLIRSGCDKSAGERIGESAGSNPFKSHDHSWAMDLEQFVQVYTHCVQRGSSAVAQQLEMAFASFDSNGKGILTIQQLREALHRVASAPVDEDRLQVVLDELANENGDITITSFSDWMMTTYQSFLKDPSRVADSITKWPDFVYNQ